MPNCVNSGVVISVAFRTPCSEECTLRGRLEREAPSGGETIRHKYKSRLTLSSKESADVYTGETHHVKDSFQDEIVLLGVLDKTTRKYFVWHYMTNNTCNSALTETCLYAKIASVKIQFFS